MHKRFQLLKSSFNASNKEKFKLDEELRSKEYKILALKEEIDNLKIMREKYEKWKTREPEITRYLNGYAALVR